MKHLPKPLNHLASILAVPFMLVLASPANADGTCDLDIRANFRTLVGAQSATKEWIAFRRIDQEISTSRTVAKDEAVFAAEFQRLRESNAMEAPTDFRFRSGWILNSQFAFAQGERLPIKAVYNLPSGETY
jgi:hypothetical protein